LGKNYPPSPTSQYTPDELLIYLTIIQRGATSQCREFIVVLSPEVMLKKEAHLLHKDGLLLPLDVRIREGRNTVFHELKSAVNVPLWEWKKIPRVEAKTLVGLRHEVEIVQNSGTQICFGSRVSELQILSP
jgi:hypothetical protein